MEAWLQGYWIGVLFFGILALVVFLFLICSWVDSLWVDPDRKLFARRALLALVLGPVVTLAWPVSLCILIGVFLTRMLIDARLFPFNRG